jgi:uncharacterized protein DUF6152
MKKMPVVALAGLGVFMAAGLASAHHAFSAEFDADKPVTVVGTLTRAEWKNPHAWIYVDVKGPDGKVSNWAVEMGPPNALLRRGWKNSSMPVGTEVKVTGYGAKNGKDMMNASTLTLPDGSTIFAGTEGTGAPAAAPAAAAPGTAKP